MKKVDTRQAKSYIQPFVNAGWTLTTLHYGDYEFEDSTGQLCLIEDKPVSKMLQDLSSGVLSRQIRGIVDNSVFPILFIRGSWLIDANGFLLGTHYTWTQVWNEMQTWQDMGVRIQLASEDNAVQRIMEIASYYEKGFHQSAMREMSGSSKSYVLSLIKGLGKAKIAQILEKFSCLLDIANADKNSLLVPGIGPKLAKNIWDFWRD